MSFSSDSISLARLLLFRNARCEIGILNSRWKNSHGFCLSGKIYKKTGGRTKEHAALQLSGCYSQVSGAPRRKYAVTVTTATVTAIPTLTAQAAAGMHDTAWAGSMPKKNSAAITIQRRI